MSSLASSKHGRSARTAASLTAFSLAVAAPLVRPRGARAEEAPFSWAESVCLAEAAIEVEVTLAPRGRSTGHGRVSPRRTLWSLHPVARVQPRLGPALPDRAALTAALRGRRHPAPGVRALIEAALGAGRYRAVHLVARDPVAGWLGNGGVVEFSLVHWSDHPKHAVWQRHLQALLDARTAAAKTGAQPPFCAEARRDPFGVAKAERQSFMR